MRSLIRTRTLVTCALLAILALGAGTGPAASAASRPSTGPFRGLGTWIDVYDYAPRFQSAASPVPAVIPASVDDMARLGVRTLYLQAAQDDTRSRGTLVDRGLVGDFLRRAHRRGLKVVAWYLPHYAQLDRDVARIRALDRFRAGHDRFDGIALDIEWTSDVKDPVLRNRALLTLARRARTIVTRVPLGAIVLEPVLLEDVNRAYWPDFPWRKLRPSFDVWLPMSYWTNRSSASGWRDGFRYAAENVRRVRARLGDRGAAVHVIGGIADTASPGDIAGFVRAARRSKSIGWSLYDWVTTSSSAWTRLRG